MHFSICVIYFEGTHARLRPDDYVDPISWAKSKGCAVDLKERIALLKSLDMYVPLAKKKKKLKKTGARNDTFSAHNSGDSSDSSFPQDCNKVTKKKKNGTSKEKQVPMKSSSCEEMSESSGLSGSSSSENEASGSYLLKKGTPRKRKMKKDVPRSNAKRIRKSNGNKAGKRLVKKPGSNGFRVKHEEDVLTASESEDGNTLYIYLF